MNKKYTVKRSATGLGLFALEDIPKNSHIIDYTGTIITNEEADKTNGLYIFYLSKTHALNGKQRTNTARYINHSCQPNAEAYTTGKRVFINSKKLIKAGEEITMNYGKDYFNKNIKPHGCGCKKCANK